MSITTRRRTTRLVYDLLLGSLGTVSELVGDDRRKQFYAERNVTKVSPILLKTFCEGFAKESSHQKLTCKELEVRAWYLRCSVSLSFVDQEVYVMYRYMT